MQATITSDQLAKIYGKLKGETAATSQQNDLVRLKELSEKRAEQWPNTIMANRRRQEEERARRLDEEEKRKQELERLSALERENERQKQIERANKILFESSEKVKNLHSKLILSDVIAEREAQIGYKKMREDLVKEQDREFLAMRNQALELAEAQELDKFRREKERLLDQQRVQLQQLEELKTRILREREEGRREGDMVRRKALEEAEAQRQAELARIERAKQAAMATKLANEALQEFKRLEKDREHATELAIDAYSKRREEIEAMRRQKEAEKKAEKQAQRDQLLRTIEANYTNIMKTEEARLTRDVQQAADRAEEDARLQRERRLAEQRAIDASRKAQLASKAAAKAAAQQEDRAFADAWKSRLNELKDEERLELQGRRLRNQDHQAFLKKQSEFKEMRRARKHEAENEDVTLRRVAQDEEDALFADYVDACTTEYEQRGRTTKFFHTALKGTNLVGTTRP